MKKNILIILLAIILGSLFIGLIFYNQLSISAKKAQIEISNKQAEAKRVADLKIKLTEEYNKLITQYKLKFKTYEEAEIAFQKAVNISVIIPDSITFQVPGKASRDDGYPYFTGRGIINFADNRCIVGNFNLVTGVGEAHENVCWFE